MATKIRLVLIFLLFLLFAFPVFGQNPGYFIDEESGFTRIIQRLVWSGGENALRYEVIIQRLQDEEYEPYLAESTENQFLEVSLPPGDYRFKVIPYDVLNRPSEESEWAYIRVLQYKEDFDEPELELKPELELEPELEFKPELEPEFEPEPELELEFEPEPEPEPEEIPQLQKFINRIKSSEFRFGAAWKPLIPLYENLYSEPFHPYGLEVSLSLVPDMSFMNLKIGMEMAMSWYSFKNTQDVFDLNVNILVVKWFSNEKCALSLRIGGLFPLQPGDREITYALGASFYWRIFKNFMLEIGADFAGNGYLYPRAGFAIMF